MRDATATTAYCVDGSHDFTPVTVMSEEDYSTELGKAWKYEIHRACRKCPLLLDEKGQVLNEVPDE